MHSCEFCGAGIADLDGALVPGSAMNEAMNRGYTPVSCPNWHVMRENTLAVLERERQQCPDPTPPINDEAVLFRWNALLRTPMKNWRLCNRCFSTLGPFLPPRNAPFPDGRHDVSPDGLQYVIPINTSPWAILASYAGLFAFVPIFAPFALILGIIAFFQLKKHPEMAGKGRAWFAIVMGILSPLLWVVFFAVMIYG